MWHSIDIIDVSLLCMKMLNIVRILRMTIFLIYIIGYDSEDLIGQYLKYYDNGFISDNEYQECGFLIRNNFHIKSKEFFDEWWKETIISLLTYQDQISFRYLVQQLKINVNYIGNNPYDNEYSDSSGNYSS